MSFTLPATGSTIKGEVLDILVQPRRDRKAALKLMRKLLKKQGVTPATVVTDKLGSYSSALRELGVARRHDTFSEGTRSRLYPYQIFLVVVPGAMLARPTRQRQPHRL